MAKTLSIYACSGIGANPNAEQQKYDYWLDNTNTITNTQAVNSLLVRINTDAIEILNLNLTDDEVLERLNEIDWYATTLYFLQQYQDKASELLQAKMAIGKAWDNGLFDYVEFDNRKRDLHLDEVIQKVSEYMDDDNIQEPSSTFSEWWEQEIASKNQHGFTQEQQQKLQEALSKNKVSGIGANYDANPDLASYLNNAGEYFLYTYATDEQIAQLPAEFKRKRSIQRSVYNYCKNMYVGVYGSEQAMQEVIYSGIVRDCKTTPEKAIEAIVATYNSRSDVSGVGVISEATIFFIQITIALIKVITMLLTVVLAIVAVICECVKAIEVAKWQSVDKQLVDSAIPAPEDYNDFNLNIKRKDNKSLLIGGVVILLALLFNRR